MIAEVSKNSFAALVRLRNVLKMAENWEKDWEKIVAFNFLTEIKHFTLSRGRSRVQIDEVPFEVKSLGNISPMWEFCLFLFVHPSIFEVLKKLF